MKAINEREMQKTTKEKGRKEQGKQKLYWKGES